MIGAFAADIDSLDVFVGVLTTSTPAMLITCAGQTAPVDEAPTGFPDRGFVQAPVKPSGGEQNLSVWIGG